MNDVMNDIFDMSDNDLALFCDKLQESTTAMTWSAAVTEVHRAKLREVACRLRAVGAVRAWSQTRSEVSTDELVARLDGVAEEHLKYLGEP